MYYHLLFLCPILWETLGLGFTLIQHAFLSILSHTYRVLISRYVPFWSWVYKDFRRKVSAHSNIQQWIFFFPAMTIHRCRLCTGVKMVILCFSSSSCLPKRIVLQVCCKKTQPFFKICCFLSQVSCSSCCPWIALSASTSWVVGLEVCLHAQFVWAFVYVVQALYQLDYIPNLHSLFS